MSGAAPGGGGGWVKVSGLDGYWGSEDAACDRPRLFSEWHQVDALRRIAIRDLYKMASHGAKHQASGEAVLVNLIASATGIPAPVIRDIIKE